MVSMEVLDGEIAALEEEKPTHVVMQKLAALYTVRDHALMGTQPQPVAAVAEYVPSMDDGSDFMTAASGMETGRFLGIMDELMTALQIANPRLYDGVMRKMA